MRPHNRASRRMQGPFKRLAGSASFQRQRRKRDLGRLVVVVADRREARSRVGLAVLHRLKRRRLHRVESDERRRLRLHKLRRRRRPPFPCRRLRRRRFLEGQTQLLARAVFNEGFLNRSR